MSAGRGTAVGALPGATQLALPPKVALPPTTSLLAGPVSSPESGVPKSTCQPAGAQTAQGRPSGPATLVCGIDCALKLLIENKKTIKRR